jgi:phosphoserine phosphatase RsbX
MACSWGAAARPKRGQPVSGDAFVIEPFTPGGLQVGLIDGLGGGEEAARAAQAAVAVVRSAPAQDPADLLRRAHLALHGTRGAVMALLSFNLTSRSLSFVGVGNIGVHVASAVPIRPISKNGIVGYRMPQLLKLAYNYQPGDTFVLFSDGVSSRLGHDLTLDLQLPPQQLAETILHRHGKDSDDATVVVVRATE